MQLLRSTSLAATVGSFSKHTCTCCPQGGDLRVAIHNDSARKLGWYGQGRSIALDVAHGIAFLHSRKVIHRDIKSKNILLTTVRACLWLTLLHPVSLNSFMQLHCLFKAYFHMVAQGFPPDRHAPPIAWSTMSRRFWNSSQQLRCGSQWLTSHGAGARRSVLHTVIACARCRRFSETSARRPALGKLTADMCLGLIKHTHTSCGMLWMWAQPDSCAN